MYKIILDILYNEVFQKNSNINLNNFFVLQQSFLQRKTMQEKNLKQNQHKLEKMFKKLNKMSKNKLYWQKRDYKYEDPKEKKEQKEKEKQQKKIKQKRDKQWYANQAKRMKKHQQFIQDKKGFLVQNQKHYFEDKLLLITDYPNNLALYMVQNNNKQSFIETIPLNSQFNANQWGDIIPTGRITKKNQNIYECNKCGSQYLMDNHYRHSCQNDFKMQKGNNKICKKCLCVVKKNHACKIKQKIWPNILTTRNDKAYKEINHQDYVQNKQIFQDPDYVISFFMSMIKQNIIEDQHFFVQKLKYSQQKSFRYNKNKVMAMLGIPKNRLQVLRILVDIICVKLKLCKISIYDLFDHYVKSLHPFRQYLPELTFQQIIQSFDFMIRLCWIIDEEGLNLAKDNIDKDLYQYLKNKKQRYVFDSEIQYKKFNSNQLKGVFLTQPITGQNIQDNYLSKAKKRLLVFKPEKWSQNFKNYYKFEIRHPVAEYFSKFRDVQIYALAKQIRIILYQYQNIRKTVESQFELIIRSLPQNRCNATNHTLTYDEINKIKTSLTYTNKRKQIIPEYTYVDYQVQAMNLFKKRDFRQFKLTLSHLKKIGLNWNKVKNNPYSSLIVQIITEQRQIQLGNRIAIRSQTIFQAKCVAVKDICKSILQSNCKIFAKQHFFRKFKEANKYQWFYIREEKQQYVQITPNFNQFIIISQKLGFIKQYRVMAFKGSQYFVLKQNINTQILNIYLEKLLRFEGLLSQVNQQCINWVKNNSYVNKLQNNQYLISYKTQRNNVHLRDQNGYELQYTKYINIQDWSPQKVLYGNYLNCSQQNLIKNIDEQLKCKSQYYQRIIVFMYKTSEKPIKVKEFISSVHQKFKIQQSIIIHSMIQVFGADITKLDNVCPIQRKYIQISQQQTFQFIKKVQHKQERQFCYQSTSHTKMIFDDLQLQKRIQGNAKTKQYIQQLHKTAKKLSFCLKTQRFLRSFRNLQIFQQYDLLYNTVNNKIQQMINNQSFQRIIAIQLDLYSNQLILQLQKQQQQFLNKIKNLPPTVQIDYIIKVVDQNNTIQGFLKPQQHIGELYYKSQQEVQSLIKLKLEEKRKILQQNILNNALKFVHDHNLVFMIDDQQKVSQFKIFCQNLKMKTFNEFCQEGKFNYGTSNTKQYKQKKKEYQLLSKQIMGYRSFKQVKYKQIADNIISEKFIKQFNIYCLDNCCQVDLIQLQQSIQNKLAGQNNYLKQNIPLLYTQFQHKNKIMQQLLQSVNVKFTNLNPQHHNYSQIQIHQYQSAIKDKFVTIFKEDQWMIAQKNNLPFNRLLTKKIQMNQFQVIQIEQPQQLQIYQSTKQKQTIQKEQDLHQQSNNYTQLTFFGQTTFLKCNLCNKKLIKGDNTYCKNIKCQNNTIKYNYCKLDTQLYVPKILHKKTCDWIKLTKNKALLELQKSGTKNNLKQFILQRRPGNYYSQIPSFMGSLRNINIKAYISKLTYQSNQAIQQYLNKSQYSPLEIRQSTVVSAGFGVFATKQLEKNVIVSSYSGNVFFQNQFKFTQQMDSIVEIGYIQNKMILLHPQNNVNVGRYFNSSVSKKKINMQPKFVVYQQQDRNILLLLLISTRKILQNEELFWDYGSDFIDLKIKKAKASTQTKSIQYNVFNVYTNQKQSFNQHQFKIYNEWVNFQKNVAKIIRKNISKRVQCLKTKKPFNRLFLPSPPQQKLPFIGKYDHFQTISFMTWQIQLAAKFKTTSIQQSTQWISRVQHMKLLRYGPCGVQYSTKPSIEVCKQKIKQQISQKKKENKIMQEFFDKNPEEYQIVKEKKKQIKQKRLLKQLQQYGPVGIYLGNNKIYQKQGPVHRNVFASLVKLINLVTCFDIMQKANILPNQVIMIPKFTKSQNATRIGICRDYLMKIQDLFYAMCISSSYQAAKSLAIYFGQIYRKLNNVQLSSVGRRNQRQTILTLRADDQNQLLKKLFIQRMIATATRLGLKNTKITDQVGLQNDSFSSVQDMQIILRHMQLKGYDMYLKVPNNRTSLKVQMRNQRNQYINLNINRTFNLPIANIWGKTGHSVQTQMVQLPHVHSFAGFIKIGQQIYSIIIHSQSSKSCLYSAIRTCRQYILFTKQTQIQNRSNIEDIQVQDIVQVDQFQINNEKQNVKKGRNKKLK